MITHDRYQTAIYFGLWSVWTVSIIAGADAAIIPDLWFTAPHEQDWFTAPVDQDLFSSEGA